MSVALLAGTLVVASLAGCAPEEENPTVIGRPRPKATPTPPPSNTSQQGLEGSLKDKGGTTSTIPTNPPALEPTPLPSWSPSAPPTLPPIIVPPTSDPTDPDANPTPEILDPSAEVNIP